MVPAYKFTMIPCNTKIHIDIHVCAKTTKAPEGELLLNVWVGRQTKIMHARDDL